MEARPPIPEDIKRQVRQEAKFGCIFCGSPIIEYHHIEPYHKVKCHEKDNLALLCPEHHHRANCGEIFKEKVLIAKKNPFNSSVNYIRKEFCLNKYENLKFSLGGGISFMRCPIILQIDEHPIISVRADENGYALFSAKFYDYNNVLLAEVIDNEWVAYLDKEFWDIQYSPGKLKINNGKNKIFLEFKIKDDSFKIRSEIYYNGYKVSFLPSKTIIGGNEFIGNMIMNGEVGVSISTLNNNVINNHLEIREI